MTSIFIVRAPWYLWRSEDNLKLYTVSHHYYFLTQIHFKAKLCLTTALSMTLEVSEKLNISCIFQLFYENWSQYFGTANAGGGLLSDGGQPGLSRRLPKNLFLMAILLASGGF